MTSSDLSTRDLIPSYNHVCGAIPSGVLRCYSVMGTAKEFKAALAQAIETKTPITDWMPFVQPQRASSKAPSTAASSPPTTATPDSSSPAMLTNSELESLRQDALSLNAYAQKAFAKKKAA